MAIHDEPALESIGATKRGSVSLKVNKDNGRFAIFGDRAQTPGSIILERGTIDNNPDINDLIRRSEKRYGRVTIDIVNNKR